MSFVDATVQNFKQVYSKVNGQRATNPDAEPAINQMKAKIEETIRGAKERDRWRFIKGAIDCFMVVDPNNPKYKQLLELTIKMLNMPGVKLKGFTQVDADTYAFFEVYDIVTQKRESYRVREGEEFHEGRFLFVRIIGNQQRAEILYKDADHVFEIGGPRERASTLNYDENTQ
jgi:hypothetical protein